MVDNKSHYVELDIGLGQLQRWGRENEATVESFNCQRRNDSDSGFSGHRRDGHCSERISADRESPVLMQGQLPVELLGIA